MASTGFQPAPQWQWPQDQTDQAAFADPPSIPGAFENGPNDAYKRHTTSILEEEPASVNQDAADNPSKPDSQSAPRQKRWLPRTCRICLDVVQPTFETPSEHLPRAFQSAPGVSYVSENPEDGRLLRPCKCKGSAKYVHEGCLQAWRLADPNSKRNFWQCPTCGFRYRLDRMNWSHWVSSSITQIGLTVSIFFLAMFLLGFIADPIINLYLDPYSAISTDPLSKINHKIEPVLSEDDVPSWAEHFLKGLASLGLLGFVKFVFALSPWQWWNIRSSGIVSGGSGRGGATGRDRMASLSWVMIVLGVATFLWVSIQIYIHSFCRSLIPRRECTKAFGPGAGEPSQTPVGGLWMLAVRTVTMMKMETHEAVSQGHFRIRGVPLKSLSHSIGRSQIKTSQQPVPKS